MTVHGDLEATLVSKGKGWNEASELVKAVLDCADDPNFAERFATEQEAEAPEDRITAMRSYWDVIRFLKSTVTNTYATSTSSCWPDLVADQPCIHGMEPSARSAARSAGAFSGRSTLCYGCLVEDLI